MATIAEKITTKRIAERTIELARSWKWLLPIETPSDWEHHGGNIHNPCGVTSIIDISLPRLPDHQRDWLSEHSGRWHFDALASTLCFVDEEDLTSYVMKFG